jgi:hypothetical protein
LLGGIAGIVYYVWSSEAELNAVIAELDRDDPGWLLEEIEAGRKMIPAAENSALHIKSVEVLLGTQSVITLAMGNAFDDLKPQKRLTIQQAEYLKTRLQVLAPALTLARNLKDMPKGRYPIKYSPDFIGTLLPHVQTARSTANLLLWDAILRAHQFDGDGALESCLAVRNAGRSLGDEPFMISQLVRYACMNMTIVALEKTLGQSSFTAASEPNLKRMQENLAKDAGHGVLLAGLRAERAGMHQLLQALAEGKIDPANYKAKGGPVKLVFGLIGNNNTKSNPRNDLEAILLERFPGYLSRQHAIVLRFYNEMIEVAKIREEQTDDRLRALEEKIALEPPILRALINVPCRFNEHEHRTRARLRCAIVGVAAERYRLAKSDWPESFAELISSGFLEAVPADPFDGKPLRMKHVADGLIIYSVGPDRTDNGGSLDPDEYTNAPKDIGFRLWDPDKRRQ